MAVSFLDVIGNALLFALVFGMSATVDTASMKNQICNKKAICLGLFCQFVMIPFLGFIAVMLLDLEPALGITLLVLVSSPGGSYSNLWCSLFNSDLALSVAMTAISTILSVVTLPVNLIIYANFAYEAHITEQIDWGSVFAALAVVISAIALGIFASFQATSLQFNVIANRIGNIAGFFLILFSATVTNTGGADSRIWSRHWTFYVACAAPCVLALLLTTVFASLLKLERPERVTVVVECCYQNIGIATSLALTMFEGDELNHAMGIPFFYGVCEAVSVGSFCFLCWKAGWTKAPRDAPLWKVLMTSYEIVAVHGDELDDPNYGVLPTIQQQTLRESDYVEMGNVHDDPSAAVRQPVSTVANI